MELNTAAYKTLNSSVCKKVHSIQSNDCPVANAYNCTYTWRTGLANSWDSPTYTVSKVAIACSESVAHSQRHITQEQWILANGNRALALGRWLTHLARTCMNISTKSSVIR